MVKYHFLNVGHGDTTIIELSDNNLMMVDINRSNEFDEESAREVAESLDLDFAVLERNSSGYFKGMSKQYDIAVDDPIAYLEDNFEQDSLFVYVQTHPDFDHFSGFKALIEKTTISNFLDTDHENIEKDKFQNDSDKEDWDSYLEYREENKKSFYRASKPIHSDDSGYSIYVFHPTKAALEAGDSKKNPDTNLFSYLILIDYNGFKVVLGGDVEQKSWKDLWEWLEDHEDTKALFKDINVLKASHHGRNSGRCGWEENGSVKSDFLNWMDPETVIISVGKKPENCDATNWYRKRPNDQSNRSVYTTRWYGTTCVSYDGTSPFDKDKVLVETRYDRQDSKDHIKPLPYDFLSTDYKLKIKAKLGNGMSGPFKKKIRSRFLPTDKWIKFTIDSDIDEPFSLIWQVVNKGEDARKEKSKGGLRGELMEDEGNKERRERTAYRGTHYMDCFAIKDNKCVAWDRFYVRIR